MKPILFLFIGTFIFSASCKKYRAGKFEGTYSLTASVNFTDTTQCRTTPITITTNASNELNFIILFGGYYNETLTATVESSKKAKIAPISDIGVMSQGGFELFGGTLTRDNDDNLILELDVIHYSDPNNMSSTGSSPFYKRHIETFTYKKD